MRARVREEGEARKGEWVSDNVGLMGELKGRMQCSISEVVCCAPCVY